MNKRFIFPTIIIGITFFVVYRVFLGSNGMINQYFISRNNGELTHKIDSLKKVLIEKDVEINRLQGDTSYIEFIARTKLGMSKKGEQVIKFIPKDSILEE